jgi:hypothetical protein
MMSFTAGDSLNRGTILYTLLSLAGKQNTVAFIAGRKC